MLTNFVVVGIGGGLGAFLRAFFTDRVNQTWHHDFPLATFLINIVGAFLLGCILHYHPHDIWLLLFGTGIMGGFTTFSTYNLELITLMKAGKLKTFILYQLFTVICGIAAAAVGMLL